jgi:acetylornithine/LysW-gamma-L-lysine aminotransferase
MDEKEVETIEQEFAADIYARKNLVVEKGKGALLWDKNGKEYIDCMGAYGVAVVGHCHPRVVDAIKHQSEMLLACHNSLYTEA